MRTILSTLLLFALVACSSYRGSEIWRRGVCDEIVDDAERARCLEDATRSENEYRRDVERAVE